MKQGEGTTRRERVWYYWKRWVKGMKCSETRQEGKRERAEWKTGSESKRRRK